MTRKKANPSAEGAPIGRSTRRHVLLPDALFAAIDEYRHSKRIDTRTEAICRLIRAGLEYETPFDPSTIIVTQLSKPAGWRK